MTVRNPLDRVDVDLKRLRAEIAVRLGRPVELVVQLATEDEPGELIVEDPDTGEWLDVDPEVVTEAVTAHQVPQPEQTPEQRALAAFDAATTVAERLAVFRAYLVRRAENDTVQQQRIRQLRRRVRRAGGA